MAGTTQEMSRRFATLHASLETPTSPLNLSTLPLPLQPESAWLPQFESCCGLSCSLGRRACSPRADQQAAAPANLSKRQRTKRSGATRPSFLTSYQSCLHSCCTWMNVLQAGALMPATAAPTMSAATMATRLLIEATAWFLQLPAAAYQESSRGLFRGPTLTAALAATPLLKCLLLSS